jgi:hypothetical protein
MPCVLYPHGAEARCRFLGAAPKTRFRAKYVMDNRWVSLRWPIVPSISRLGRFLAAWSLVLFWDPINMGAEEMQSPPKFLELLDNGKVTSYENLLLDPVENDIRASPQRAPNIVTRELGTDVSNPLTFAGHIVQRGIEAFGPNPNQIEIALIVRAAVKARPTAVLEIVRAAIGASPPRFHSDVVAAAVAGVQDPYLRITVTKLTELFGETLHTIRHPIWWDRILGVEGNQELVEEIALGYTVDEAEGLTKGLSKDTTTLWDDVTLAEAIVNAAIQAGSPINAGTLMQAVDLVLTTESDTIITVQPPSTPSPTPPPVSP